MIKKLKRCLNSISDHFTKTEFKCSCGCGECFIDPELVKQAEFIRCTIGLPMIVHCVNRCATYNNAVGGALYSQHIGGHAMDFHIKKVPINKLHDFVIFNWERKALNGGLGIYDWGVHIDTGPYRSWGLHKDLVKAYENKEDNN